MPWLVSRVAFFLDSSVGCVPSNLAGCEDDGHGRPTCWDMSMCCLFRGPACPVVSVIWNEQQRSLRGLRDLSACRHVPLWWPETPVGYDLRPCPTFSGPIAATWLISDHCHWHGGDAAPRWRRATGSRRGTVAAAAAAWGGWEGWLRRDGSPPLRTSLPPHDSHWRGPRRCGRSHLRERCLMDGPRRFFIRTV